MYNPPMLGDVNGLLGAINMGNAVGGTNWPGGALRSGDPRRLHAGQQHRPHRWNAVAAAGRILRHPLRVGRCRPTVPGSARARATAAPPTRRAPRRSTRDELTGSPRVRRPGRRPRLRRHRRAAGDRGTPGGLTIDGISILKPPYGLISAINLDRGEIMWQTPHGDTPDNIRNHPALRGMTIPKTGQAGTSGIGLMVTKTLVVMGDPQLTTTPEHPRGAMFRAYDKQSGKEVGAVFMSAPQSGSPMTYMVDGKQYIVDRDQRRQLFRGIRRLHVTGAVEGAGRAGSGRVGGSGKVGRAGREGQAGQAGQTGWGRRGLSSAAGHVPTPAVHEQPGQLPVQPPAGTITPARPIAKAVTPRTATSA